MSEPQHPNATPIARSALDYITKYGWTIVAVGENKRPLGEWGPGGPNRYDYTNPERCLQLTAPGIGVITGPSNLVIIDLDNNDAIRAWADAFGIPMTRTAHTPRGRHLYYQAPPGLHIPPGTEIMPGVDVRGGESYAILPPSRLTNGAYSWSNTDAPFQPLPDAVRDLVLEARPKRKAKILSGAPFDEGNRNDHLFSMACSMRRGGFDYTSILAALIETNKTRCAPMLSLQEIESITDSAISYEEGDHNGIDLATSLRAKAATREPDEEPVLASHARVLDTRVLVEDAPPIIDWIWDDFLAPGTLNMLHGEGGLGKSFIALKIAEQVVSPKPDQLFGKDIHQGNVIIIDGENAESQIHRRVQYTTIRSDAQLSVYIANNVILGLAELTEEYFDHINKTHAPKLIIIDSQRALWAGDEKEQAEAGQMLRRFARYLEHQPYAVLLIHHDNRGGDYSGSSDINAAITGCRMHIRRHSDKDKPNARILTQPKNRIAAEMPLQQFLLDIDQQPASHRHSKSGISFTHFTDDQAMAINAWVDQIITTIYNPGPDFVTYKDAWAMFGWETVDGKLASKHDDDWKAVKQQLEKRGYTINVSGRAGGTIQYDGDSE
jgi:hypothetical protein